MTRNIDELKKEWQYKGESYATEVNKMVEFGEKNGWENWHGEEPNDDRQNLAKEVFKLLCKANEENSIDEFRGNFPPAHSPFIEFFQQQGQSIEHLHFISDQKIVFLTGTSYQGRVAYSLDGDFVTKLPSSITAIGKAKKGNVFAIASSDKIITFENWEGEAIAEFTNPILGKIQITEMIPFNNGKKILLVSSDGVYLLSESEEQMVHPTNKYNNEDWSSNMSMENATLSNNNDFIAVGDQCSEHIILDTNLNLVSSVYPESSYPHFCLFSKDDEQLILNSCHFYNGVTVGVVVDKLSEIKIEDWEKSDSFTIIDEELRVYTGLSTSDFYILGDAFGYIRAFDKKGNKLWRHFFGSTISGMTISEDEKTLWVGSYSGMLHKLQLGKGHRDNNTIGNGNHYEEFRLICWKAEPNILKW